MAGDAAGDGSDTIGFGDLFAHGSETESEDEETWARRRSRLVTHALSGTRVREFGVEVGATTALGLWDAALVLADVFQCGSLPEVQPHGRSVCELGAGLGLPFIVAARLGAAWVVATDWNDEFNLSNLEHNFGLNDVPSERFRVVPYLWGAPAGGVLALRQGARFDLVCLCDIIYTEKGHAAQVDSVRQLLSPGGVAVVSFSHNCQPAATVAAFFAAAAAVGLENEPVDLVALGVPDRPGVGFHLLRWPAREVAAVPPPARTC